MTSLEKKALSQVSEALEETNMAAYYANMDTKKIERMVAELRSKDKRSKDCKELQDIHMALGDLLTKQSKITVTKVNSWVNLLLEGK